jgi:acyl-CoA reductase-like NAD-dependent aldehyde dehydrogenase
MITKHTGKPITESREEFNKCILRIDKYCDLAESALCDEKVVSNDSVEKVITKQPVGTVFTFPSWIHPLLSTFDSLLPSILSGNSVLIKHHTQTS